MMAKCQSLIKSSAKMVLMAWKNKMKKETDYILLGHGNEGRDARSVFSRMQQFSPQEQELAGKTFFIMSDSSYLS